VLDAMQLVLENKVARAATMVSNGVDELRSGLGKARGSIARGRTAAALDSEPELELVDGVLKAVP